MKSLPYIYTIIKNKEIMNRNVIQFGNQAMSGKFTKAQLGSMLNKIQSFTYLTDEEYNYCVGMMIDFGKPSK